MAQYTKEEPAKTSQTESEKNSEEQRQAELDEIFREAAREGILAE